jgi:hypothetical protein
MIYIKTNEGQQAFKERSPQMPAKLRTAFLLFDGHRSEEDVLIAIAGLGLSQTDIGHLVSLGFLVVAQQAQGAVGSSEALLEATQTRFIKATHLATALTASLGLRGFRLNLAIESANDLADLRALLPDIEDACGADACIALRNVLSA